MHADDFTHQNIQVNGLNYHYVRQGQGAPLLLIHGWPGFWYEWHLNIGPLSQHFDVVAPDMRGYAYTDKPDLPPEEGYTDAAFAEDIRGLCDALGFEKVRIVTHDFGAIWVQKFARLYPERVERMVMFDPPYPGGTGRGFQLPHVFNIWYQMFHQLPLAESLVGSSREATRIYISWFLAAWSANRDLFTQEEIEKYTDAYSQPGALRGGFNCYRSAYRGGAFSAGGDAKVMPKTLVLWGDSDAIFPFEFSDQLGNTFDDFELKKIEGAGHFMMREAPDRVNGEIIDFMRV